MQHQPVGAGIGSTGLLPGGNGGHVLALLKARASVSPGGPGGPGGPGSPSGHGGPGKSRRQRGGLNFGKAQGQKLLRGGNGGPSNSSTTIVTQRNRNNKNIPLPIQSREVAVPEGRSGGAPELLLNVRPINNNLSSQIPASSTRATAGWSELTNNVNPLEPIQGSVGNIYNNVNPLEPTQGPINNSMSGGSARRTVHHRSRRRRRTNRRSSLLRRYRRRN
jgi:hypothetical protein